MQNEIMILFIIIFFSGSVYVHLFCELLRTERNRNINTILTKVRKNIMQFYTTNYRQSPFETIAWSKIVMMPNFINGS